MEKLVLMIDDDRLPMQFYVKALKLRGFKVKHCLDPDSALDFAEENRNTIAGIILDVMMPPGRKYRHQPTNQGLRTGVFLLKNLREYCANTPVIVLTNVRNPRTLGEFKEEPLLKVVQKTDCPPFELAELMDGLVNEHKRESGT